MSLRDYRNLPWQNQQPLVRNPNPYRSMRDYRDQGISAPFYSVSPTYAPPASPYYASTPQSQPPQSISPIEQAILNLTKLVGDVVEEQKKFNAQLSKKIHTVGNSLNQRIDGLQSEMEHKFDNLQYSISRLANQHVHQEKESQEEECLSDTMVEEQCQQQLLLESSDIGAAIYPWEKKEAVPLLLTEEAVEEHNNLPLPPIDSVYILPSPAAQFTLKTPVAKAKASLALPAMQNFKKLVATVQNFTTTSKTMAAAHIAWHSGWFGCWFGFGAPEPLHF